MVALSLLRYLASTYSPLRRAYNRGYVDATAAARRNAERRAAEQGKLRTVWFGEQVSPSPNTPELDALVQSMREAARDLAVATAIPPALPSAQWENCILQDCPLTCCPDVCDEAVRDCR